MDTRFYNTGCIPHNISMKNGMSSRLAEQAQIADVRYTKYT